MQPDIADAHPDASDAPIVLDGSMGEGGGQVLRTSLALACLTGRALELSNIRAGRAKPGLMRQHLTCVQAAARVSGARVEGAELSSTALVFEPAGLWPLTARFDIGTAGATGLVVQTILLPLLFANGESRVELTGGTHVMAAPSFTFLSNTFAPLVRAMGADFAFELHRAGYYPAGGGRVELVVRPLAEGATLAPLELDAAAADDGMHAIATTAKIPESVGRRELRQLAALLPIGRKQLFERRDKDSVGPGNVVAVHVPLDDARTSVFTSCGKRGVPAEKVASDLAAEVRAFTSARVAVDEHLADQLLLPLALAGGGSFTTTAQSLHTRTNAEVIEAILGTRFEVDELGEGRFRVRVEGEPLLR